MMLIRTFVEVQETTDQAGRTVYMTPEFHPPMDTARLTFTMWPDLAPGATEGKYVMCNWQVDGVPQAWRDAVQATESGWRTGRRR
jgi:hypothetical protein